MNNYDNTNKGAVWLKTSKNGLKYMSGTVDVNGIQHDIAIFKNDKKGNDKAPDYRLNITLKDGQAIEPSQAEVLNNVIENDSDHFAEFGTENQEDLDSLPF